ncbi:MAG: hypothetical protein WC708_19380 [Lentisphaeria bacterium]
MKNILHITSGDCAGSRLAAAGLGGEILVWHDLLYDGPCRPPGWPDAATLAARAAFLEAATGGGLNQAQTRHALDTQYARLAAAAAAGAPLVLWFDACLFDQAMLAHVLACLRHLGVRQAELLCVDAFPWIEPYDGLGQLQPADFTTLYPKRQPVTDEQFRFAETADRAFATQDAVLLVELARAADAPLPWLPAAAARWLGERPDPATGLGRLETLALAAVRAGCDTPKAIYAAVAAQDGHPQYWGDTTLWAKLNALADRTPPLVQITGPAPRLPQWPGGPELERFQISSGAVT